MNTVHRKTVVATRGVWGYQLGMIQNGGEQQFNLLQAIGDLYVDLGVIRAPDVLLKRLDFLFHEFYAKIDKNLNANDRLEVLRQFFYEEKIFGISQLRTLEGYILTHVVKALRGDELCLAILFRSLAERLQLKLDFIVWPGKVLLRFVDENGAAFYISPEKRGVALPLEELFVSMQEQMGLQTIPADLLESKSESEMFLLHLNELKKAYYQQQNWDRILRLLDIELEIMPQKFKALGQKAMVLAELQKTPEAVQCFRRYFNFVEETMAPAEFVTTYKKCLGVFAHISDKHPD